MSDDTDDNIVQLSIVKPSTPGVLGPSTPELMIEVSDNPADGVISILEEMLERAKNGQMIVFETGKHIIMTKYQQIND